ncbi:hypothetical protein SUGI_1225350 [Cryptomeria japonica]|uniref:Uncharacterized protein n=1 Tax=Cryptomeria japonica TaxID=3369 RepID=A0AAD3RPE2_CRYJA|nr:hypothetical protein SUGI_1225350 [Cryptomeria japonica]
MPIVSLASGMNVTYIIWPTIESIIALLDASHWPLSSGHPHLENCSLVQFSSVALFARVAVQLLSPTLCPPTVPRLSILTSLGILDRATAPIYLVERPSLSLCRGVSLSQALSLLYLSHELSSPPHSEFSLHRRSQPRDQPLFVPLMLVLLHYLTMPHSIGPAPPCRRSWRGGRSRSFPIVASCSHPRGLISLNLPELPSPGTSNPGTSNPTSNPPPREVSSWEIGRILDPLYPKSPLRSRRHIVRCGCGGSNPDPTTAVNPNARME